MARDLGDLHQVAFWMLNYVINLQVLVGHIPSLICPGRFLLFLDRRPVNITWSVLYLKVYTWNSFCLCYVCYGFHISLHFFKNVTFVNTITSEKHSIETFSDESMKMLQLQKNWQQQKAFLTDGNINSEVFQGKLSRGLGFTSFRQYPLLQLFKGIQKKHCYRFGFQKIG